jgi:two-component system, cell cycle response regulator
MLDIDHFKDYNDRYGHSSGDTILKYIASTITGLLDETDIAGRYGGEEIAILLWRKNKKEAVLLADRIRRLIKQRTIEIKKQESHVTVSIGVATYPVDAVAEDDLIRVADSRLYKAKADGRDRVCSD